MLKPTQPPFIAGPLAFRPGCANTGDKFHIELHFHNQNRWPEMLTEKAKYQLLTGI